MNFNGRRPLLRHRLCGNPAAAPAPKITQAGRYTVWECAPPGKGARHGVE